MNTDVLHRRRFFSIFFAACVVAGMALASTASAGSITVSGTTLYFKGGPAEANVVYVDANGSVRDYGASLVAGSACNSVTVKEASCSLAGVKRIRVLTRDGNDYVTILSALPATIDGGLGDDRLIGGAGDDLLIGGRGNDYLAGASGTDAFLGGTDDDTVLATDGVSEHVNCGIGNDIAGIDDGVAQGPAVDRAHRCELDWTHIDDSAKAAAARVVAAMEACAQRHNSMYSTVCDNAAAPNNELLTIDPTLNDFATLMTVAPNTPAGGYTISMYANRAGTHVYTVTRYNSGIYTRTCAPTNDGGCPASGIW
jgi:hypothetical protein